MKIMHRLLALLAIIVMMASFTSAYAADDGFANTYTYNYDYWGDIRESPDAYRVENIFFSSTLKLEVPLKNPTNLFVRDNYVYVCDSGNNRIVELVRRGSTLELSRIIDTVKGADPATFNMPNDMFVDKEGNIYVCDTNNGRIVMMDKDTNFIQSFVKPTDNTFDQSISFLPLCLTVDSSGRVYALARNVNKGMMKFESDTTFTGFVGANKVKYSLYEYIWKNFLSTKEQRARQEQFIPTEYCNLYMDDDSFIYATNVVFSEYDLLYDVAQPIRRLNGIGNDILIKNDVYPPIGDLDWVEQNNHYGPSKFYDITALDNEIYVGIDKTRGRVFGYDSQGIMLWAFGTSGGNVGAFNSAISIEHMGKDLLVLDDVECSITLFTPTEYGTLIYDANEAYLRGDYDGSAVLWEEVLKHNANYNLAFIGIGRALMRQDKYKEAMGYFKMAMDRDNYGRAFRLYRKIWVEENVGWLVAIIAAIIIIPLAIRFVKKKKMEVEAYEHSKISK